jgi:RNA polymerase sigma-70 factor (ECF subfamily)
MLVPTDFDGELTVWVGSYTRELLSWAARRTGDVTAAEDLVQETFLAAAERIAEFRRDSQPRTWLFAILNNKIAEYYRKKAKMQTTPWEGEDIAASTFAEDGHWKEEKAPRDWENPEESLFDNPDFVRIFEECLSALPANWHGCLTSKFFQNRSPEEICQELGISTTNYWQIIHRAKLKMRTCIEVRWFSGK